jgi:putative ABC transport system permease protein
LNNRPALLEDVIQDLRYTLRTLRRDMGFCAVAVLILGLGIGANTAIFSVVNAVLIRSLPFRDPGRLVWIANTGTSGLSGATTRVANFDDWRNSNQSFEDLAAYFAFFGEGDDVLTSQGEPERLGSVGVSENFFGLLGIQPQLGRLFTPEECKWNGRRAALLSHGLWRRRFASDPGIVGQTITLNDKPVQVVGVMPPSFDFASIFTPNAKIDLYTPFPIAPETDRWGNTLAVVGRLKPGVSVQSAQAELEVINQQLRIAHPERGTRWGARLTGLQDYIGGRLRRALIVLACAVGVVMLIVCSNLSNLLLARAASRQKEIALRAALGAGRFRLIRQMLTESLVLSFCGGVLGVFLAYASTRSFASLPNLSIPLLHYVELDGTTLGFTMLITLITGLVFGLAPALQISGFDLHEALKDTSRGSSHGRQHGWIRSSLVVTEVALACVLLVGAGLLIRSFLRVLDVDLGFQPAQAAALRVDPSPGYSTRAQQNGYFDDVIRRVEAVPGIESAGLTDALPLGRNRSWGLRAKGQTYAPGQAPVAFVRIVSEGYLKAMRIPLRAGRDFTPRDSEGNESAIIINETLARILWPGQDPIGQKILGVSRTEATVVGVVGDVRHLALERDAGSEMYLPIRQGGWSSVDLVVRTKLPPSSLASSVRAVLRPINPSLPAGEFRTLDQLVDRAVSPRRFVVWLLGGFAFLALILSSLGIFGVISYSVNQRTQEIGIRMALGASPRRMQAGVIRQAMSLVSIGIVLGGAGAWALARLLGSLLYGVTPSDPVTFLMMTGALTIAAMAAGYLPARRASTVDPMSALRSN